MSRPMTRGRGFAALNQKGERAAFAAWMRARIKEHGGRAKVAEITGISTDSLSKWAGGRALPSQVNMQKLIDGEVVSHDSVQSLLAESPWLGSKYRKEAMAVATKPETVQAEPAPVYAPERMNLMDAVLSEPGLTTKQRAQLAGLITMVVNGVDITIDISPAPRA
jgi:hypothetical protein